MKFWNLPTLLFILLPHQKHLVLQIKQGFSQLRGDNASELFLAAMECIKLIRSFFQFHFLCPVLKLFPVISLSKTSAHICSQEMDFSAPF